MPEADDILSEAERKALATASVGAPRVAPLKVLIVEDDKGSRHALASYFKAHGIRCLVAENTSVAFDYLKRKPEIGMLITDLRMQPVGGIEFIKQIRESDKAALPIIIVSGDANVQDAIAAMHLSVVDFLLKPLDGDKLAKLVELVKRELGIG